MPTYDYICGSCGHRLEVVHGIHGHGPEACPVCGGRMRKAFVAPAVHFKGSGWAKKDRGTTASTRAGAKAGAGDEASTGAARTGETKGGGTKSSETKAAGRPDRSGRPASSSGSSSPAGDDD